MNELKNAQSEDASAQVTACLAYWYSRRRFFAIFTIHSLVKIWPQLSAYLTFGDYNLNKLKSTLYLKFLRRKFWKILKIFKDKYFYVKFDPHWGSNLTLVIMILNHLNLHCLRVISHKRLYSFSSPLALYRNIFEDISIKMHITTSTGT